MSWIDEDKAASDEGDNRRRTDVELRSYKAALIAAKAPSFLGATIEHLRSDCARLAAEFSRKLEKQCSFSSDSYTHTLQGCKLPWKVLKMRFNFPGHCVEIVESRREARDRVVPVGSDEVRIAVNEEDELEFYFRGTRYLTPDALSAGLIRYVRGN